GGGGEGGAERTVPRAAQGPPRKMARGNRPQASRGHRHGRAARRAAPAEKIKPETQSAEQTEIPAQGARVTARRLGSIKTNTLIWRQSCRRDGSTPARTGWRSHMQLNAFFPSLDIGNDPAKIRDLAQAAERLGQPS